MGFRFLFTRSCYIWGAVLVLACFPGLTHAAKEWRTLVNEGISTREQTYWFKELHPSFSGRQTTSLSTLPLGGKNLPIPTNIKAAASAGSHLAKFAKVASPAALGFELLGYLLDNIPELGVSDDEWSKARPINEDPETGEFGPRVWYRTAGYNGDYPSGDAICAQADAVPFCASQSQFTFYPNPANPNSGNCKCTYNGQLVLWNVSAIASTACPTGSVTKFDAGLQTVTCTPLEDLQDEPQTPTDQDWQDWGELLPLMSDAELEEMARKHPDGVPIETPTTPTLPQTQPLSDAYQDPSTGTWWQDVAKLSPAPWPNVGTETKIIPVSGPEGIEEPVPYTGPETDKDLDTGEPQRVTVEGDTTINVEICAEGDTRLMCTELGTPPDDEVPKDDFDLDWSHDPVVFTEGACPTGPSASTPWGTVTFDMYWPCEFAKAMKPIILVCSMFAAIYIFITGLRTE